MNEHTPGPWTVEEYGDDDAPALVIHKDSVTRVCFMATPGSHGDPAKIEADAYLIASAPDLLAALRTCSCPRPVNTVPAGVDLTVEQCIERGECGCDCGAAIRKATGAA